MPLKLPILLAIGAVVLSAGACGPERPQPAPLLIESARSSTDWLVEGSPPPNRSPEAQRARLQLQRIRAACEVYKMTNGNRYPDFKRDGWAPLLATRHLRDTPANPLSPPEVASRIVIVEPGVTGRKVDPMKAGWAWQDRGRLGGIMYAAGIDR